VVLVVVVVVGACFAGPALFCGLDSIDSLNIGFPPYSNSCVLSCAEKIWREKRYGMAGAKKIWREKRYHRSPAHRLTA